MVDFYILHPFDFDKNHFTIIMQQSDSMYIESFEKNNEYDNIFKMVSYTK